ncbi:RHO1 GDP-GTP exchange protein 2, partial [Irineochytrium annulatum]
VGVCTDRTLLCAVRTAPLTSTVKVFEPVGLGNSKRRGKLGKLFMGSSDSLRLFKEFYVPAEASSIHFLKTKFCVGCAKGFEIVDFETLDTQGLLDPSDSSLVFAMGKENLKPISIFRVIENNYILCYNAFVSPYIIAFEPTFAEVWNVNTGILQQVLPINGLRPLDVVGDCMLGVMEDDKDNQIVFKLQKAEREE